MLLGYGLNGPLIAIGETARSPLIAARLFFKRHPHIQECYVRHVTLRDVGGETEISKGPGHGWFEQHETGPVFIGRDKEEVE